MAQVLPTPVFPQLGHLMGPREPSATARPRFWPDGALFGRGRHPVGLVARFPAVVVLAGAVLWSPRGVGQPPLGRRRLHCLCAQTSPRFRIRRGDSGAALGDAPAGVHRPRHRGRARLGRGPTPGAPRSRRSGQPASSRYLDDADRIPSRPVCGGDLAIALARPRPVRPHRGRRSSALGSHRATHVDSRRPGRSRERPPARPRDREAESGARGCPRGQLVAAGDPGSTRSVLRGHPRAGVEPGDCTRWAITASGSGVADGSIRPRVRR